MQSSPGRDSTQLDGLEVYLLGIVGAQPQLGGHGDVLRVAAGALAWQLLQAGDYHEAMLRLLFPYLSIKQDQAELALKFRATLGRGGNSRGTPPSIIKLREAYRKQLSAMKRGKVIELDGSEQELENQMESQLALPSFDTLPQ